MLHNIELLMLIAIAAYVGAFVVLVGIFKCKNVSGTLFIIDISVFITAASAIYFSNSATSSLITISVTILVFIFALIASTTIVSQLLLHPILASITPIKDGTDQVAVASEQVSSSSQQLAQSSNEQAASVDDILKNIQEITKLTSENSEKSTMANELGSAAQESAEHGAGAMEVMNDVMGLIKSSANEMAGVIKSIDEIAFQTNLLALNAAVEAARAGDAGAGFAVVADEVRNLALRAADAARTTSDMIETSKSHVESGVVATEEFGKVLNDILENVRNVKIIIDEVAYANDQQSERINQISISVSEIQSTTQSNASIAEESAAASEELSSQSENLKDIIINILDLNSLNRTTSSEIKAFNNTASNASHYRTLSSSSHRQNLQHVSQNEIPLTNEYESF